MTIGEFGRFHDRCLEHRRRVLVVGPPGCGKTFEKQASCRRMGFQFIGLCTPLQSPVKVGGYPRPPVDIGGDASHALFNGIAAAFRATKPTLLNFGDLGMGNGETLKSILDLVQFGTIDERHLPECVVVGADSNDVGHGADVQGLVEPLKNRWHSIVHVETSIPDVIVYGLAKGWPGWLLGWINNYPDWVGSWKPTKSLKVDGCTARGLEYVAEWDALGIDDVEVWGGAVGEGHARTMVAFKALQADLPDVNQVLLDPAGAPVPDNPSARWLIGMALAGKLTGKTFAPILLYLQRLPQPLRCFTIKSALHAESKRRAEKTLPAGHQAIHASRDFAAWCNSGDGKDILAADAALKL